ncbi:hypothetical protein I2492_06075 [Budviciaceae bacterium CWB-B4]|uniref:Uncharacterized protein n=1 Tax=Limnobaculum xujianqingii TaxID=2738837 RepID=A0A9D7AH13_9GAMM|nr:DUF6631 family protein [Limnobaculum xujianqingii]MBK5072576.1 hypothetical protein [Limnobaculum xujianqingii]MBK5175885.1 hypothetical protein [Limnobaculum xujianqingii]
MDESLETLFPERHATLGGVDVVIHEYTLAEQLRHRQPLKVISTAFADLMASLPPDNTEIPLDALYDILAANENAVLEAVAVSCSQSVDWVSGLQGEDSETLLLLWWGVNAGFFTRSALRPVLEKMARKAQESLPAGESFSSVLSTTGTDSKT